MLSGYRDDFPTSGEGSTILVDVNDLFLVKVAVLVDGCINDFTLVELVKVMSVVLTNLVRTASRDSCD